MIAALFAALVVADADPCAAIVPAAAPDPATAAAYREVGDAERAAGRSGPAAVAYRAAASLDPGDAAAREALDALCRDRRAEGAFDRGLRLMQAGDCRAAVPALEEARAAGERSAALLAGICLHELDEDGRAERLLREAEAHPPTRDQARFFLGLLALEKGRSSEAASLLEASAADPDLAPLARGLSRAARGSGRLSLSAVAEAGWDSNADLTPGASAAPSGASDGEAGLTAALTYSPLGARGPYARLTGTATEQVRFDEFDLRGLGVAAGWRGGSRTRTAAVEYGYERQDLGGAPYLSAHRLLASGRLAFTPAIGASLAYEGRAESFSGDFEQYSGARHVAEAEVTLVLTRGRALAAAWRGGHDGARSDALASWAHGPRLSARVALGRSLRAGADVAWTWRSYDAYDADLGVRRTDQYLDASALAEWDLGDRFTVQVVLAARRAFSNVAEFEYTRVVPTIALAYARGLL